MTWLILIGLTGSIAQADSLNQLTPDELAKGWLLLFDGETLFGWRAAGEANFRVESGAIVVDQGEVCLLRTTTQFGDYVLRADFQAAADTNSGIFLHTSPRPTSPASDCYELNIAPPDNPFPTASLVQRQRVGQEVRPQPDQWHTFQVAVNGGRIEVQLDGQVVLTYRDARPLRRGFIGLQHNQGRVAFRNIKLQPLNLVPIFNGRDLTGWKTYPQSPARFSVTPEGHLYVEGGRGQLESEGMYGDFVFQLQCVTHGKHLNSGIFFRCIPGQELMGYESQIHNGYRDGDRSQPIDCGTGGIFRRSDARRVMADDFQWFHKTIVADGAHMAVWVNGFQVTDWTDTRPPHQNPRRGRRTEPGTLMIQAHDPTTKLSLRALRIAAIAPRQTARRGQD